MIHLRTILFRAALTAIALTFAYHAGAPTNAGARDLPLTGEPAGASGLTPTPIPPPCIGTDPVPSDGATGVSIELDTLSWSPPYYGYPYNCTFEVYYGTTPDTPLYGCGYVIDSCFFNSGL